MSNPRNISLGQVEDELREAEAYLLQGPTKPLAVVAPSAMSEARRKEILAKLSAEREALRQRKLNPPSPVGAQEEKRQPLPPFPSFMDSEAFFPLPFDHNDPPPRLDADDGSTGDYDDSDDGDFDFLKELQRADGNDSLFFASDIHSLPAPPSAAFDDDAIESPPASPSHRLQRIQHSVRFEMDQRDSGPFVALAPNNCVAHDDAPPRPSTTRSRPSTSSATTTTSAKRGRKSPPPFSASRHRPASTSHSEQAHIPKPPRVANARRIHELAQSVNYAAREKLKMQQELATLSACTFQPPSSSAGALKTPEKHATRTRRGNAWSPHKKSRVEATAERLHVEGALRFELRDKVKQVLEDQHVRQTCTFKPKINAATERMVRKDSYKPIHARLPEIQRQKKELLRQLERAMDKQSELTFVPAINAQSHKLSEELTKLNVTDRLVQDAEECAEKKLQVQAYYAALQDPSFCPQVNDRSHAIVDQKPEFKLNFVTRQQVLQAQTEQKFEAKLALEERIQAEEKPFQPCIGNTNQVLQHTRPKRLLESTPAQLYRMTYEEPHRRELATRRAQAQQAKQFTHKPTLNPVSQSLGRPTPVQKLASKAAVKPIRSRVVQEMEAKEQAECRFRPDVASADHIDRTSVWNPSTCLQQIELARATRQQKLEDQRHCLEFEQLQACTFAPAINKYGAATTSSPPKPVVVRGLGRFLELKHLAKRQEEELRQRQAKAFTQTRDYTPRAYTIPHPFKLSVNQRRRRAAKSDLDADAECTFEPATLERKNRRFIQSLLN
ncbi:Aste57867_21861 [Aphanomyces stellatus]|uniref:Aste57867_21861 protein n=1 Tax=Aphanomyces stellatus TaxID=120398 RepID=A0A485LJB5_9STRA|nr:hypothetical protein As57867_021792 [Aphanomyces stellatus]VFT98530.1 Aste57867_21861 [Aphanomyces stellatus]